MLGVDEGYSSRGGFEFPMGRRTPQSNTGSGTPGAPADSESHRPWRWLGLFGRFLLLWPALALFGAVEDFDGETELEDFLVVAFVPALVGIVFVALDWLLTKTLSGAVEKRGHPVPSVFRDVSNVCLTLFVGGGDASQAYHRHLDPPGPGRPPGPAGGLHLSS